MSRDRIQAVEAARASYPHTFRAPYAGIPRDVDASFVWVPFEAEGYALFMFDSEEARDFFASQFDGEVPELPRVRRRKFAA